MTSRLERTTRIEAPAPVVWDVVADLLRWPGLTASISSIEAVDDSELRPGNRFLVKQPRMPQFCWEVTRVTPGRGWSWRQRTSTGTTTASHDLEPLDSRTTALHLRVLHSGLLRTIVGRLTRGQAERFLVQEAHGIRRESERRHAAS